MFEIAGYHNINPGYRGYRYMSRVVIGSPGGYSCPQIVLMQLARRFLVIFDGFQAVPANEPKEPVSVRLRSLLEFRPD